MKSALPQPSQEAKESPLRAGPGSATATAAWGNAGSLRFMRLLLVYAALAALLYFALRNAPLTEILNAVGQLQLSQLAVLFLLNALVIAAMTARWWVIVRAENPGMPFLPMIRYRLAV